MCDLQVDNEMSFCIYLRTFSQNYECNLHNYPFGAIEHFYDPCMVWSSKI